VANLGECKKSYCMFEFSYVMVFDYLNIVGKVCPGFIVGMNS
jgi:hypothetical protein